MLVEIYRMFTIKIIVNVYQTMVSCLFKKNDMPREVCYSDFTMITVLLRSDGISGTWLTLSGRSCEKQTQIVWLNSPERCGATPAGPWGAEWM